MLTTSALRNHSTASEIRKGRSRALNRFRKAVKKVLKQIRKKKEKLSSMWDIKTKIGNSVWLAGLMESWHSEAKKNRMERENHEMVVKARAALTKKLPDRSLEEIKMVAGWLKSMRLPVFSDIAPEAMEELAKFFHFRNFEKKDIIIRQGDEGDEFLILVEGEVSVHIARPGDAGVGRGVAIVSGCRSFGDETLFRKSKWTRCATVLATKPGSVLVISSKDSRKAVQALGHHAADEIINHRNEKVKFLASHYLFKGWKSGRVSSFGYCMKTRMTDRGTWLYKNGDKASSVFFLVKGECIVMTPETKETKHTLVKKKKTFLHVTRKEDTMGYLKVMTVGRGSLLGEEEIIHGNPHRRLAIWCTTKCKFYKVPRYHFNRYMQGPHQAKLRRILEAKVHLEERLLSAQKSFAAIMTRKKRTVTTYDKHHDVKTDTVSDMPTMIPFRVPQSPKALIIPGSGSQTERSAFSISIAASTSRTSYSVQSARMASSSSSPLSPATSLTQAHTARTTSTKMTSPRDVKEGWGEKRDFSLPTRRVTEGVVRRVLVPTPREGNESLSYRSSIVNTPRDDLFVKRMTQKYSTGSNTLQRHSLVAKKTRPSLHNAEKTKKTWVASSPNNKQGCLEGTSTEPQTVRSTTTERQPRTRRVRSLHSKDYCKRRTQESRYYSSASRRQRELLPREGQYKAATKRIQNFKMEKAKASGVFVSKNKDAKGGAEKLEPISGRTGNLRRSSIESLSLHLPSGSSSLTLSTSRENAKSSAERYC